MPAQVMNAHMETSRASVNGGGGASVSGGKLAHLHLLQPALTATRKPALPPNRRGVAERADLSGLPPPPPPHPPSLAPLSYRLS